MRPLQASASTKFVMSSRNDARRKLLASSKKKTDGQRLFSRPLENQKFYFHFKNRRPHSQLTQDLTSLGARVEPFFGKDVSCVITDQQDLGSASTPTKPNSVDSSGPFTSPSVSTGPSASTEGSGNRKSSLRTGRGQVLVRKAIQNVSGSTDVLELCRQWQIQVCYIKSFLPWVQKLKDKALLENAKHWKENAIAKQVYEPPEKLVPPFIKVEDMRRVFRPMHESLKEWPDVAAERCQEIATEPKEPVPKKRAPLPKESAASTKEPVEAINDSHLKGVPLRPGTSKETSHVKVTEQKKLNCEICGISFICLEKHLESEKHENFMKNPNNFSVVSDMISMLPCKLPSRVAHPLSEINGQDWLTEAPSISDDEENILGLPTDQPWASPPQTLTIKTGHHSVVTQSGFSGTISALRHLKVVRKESSSTVENLEKINVANSPHPQKWTATSSNIETRAVVKKDSRSLLRCNVVDYKENTGVPLTAGGSRLRKRAATFSEFGAQAVAKKDASVILCCSDMDGLKDKCVPPSFSSELNGTVKNLLVDLNLEDGHSASTPAENAGNFVCDMSEVFDKASEELFSDASTAEYSWTYVESGVVPKRTASKTQCDEASDLDSNDSFLEFVSRANVLEQPKGSHAAENKMDKLCGAGDAERLCSGNVRTVQVEPFGMRL